MSEWLKIVKKHAKLNPGKSLRDFLPAAKLEYQKLKASGKVVLKSAVKTAKRVVGGKKHRKHSSKRTKKQRGGSRDRDADDEEEDEDEEVEHEVVENNEEDENYQPEMEPEPEDDSDEVRGGRDRDDIAGGRDNFYGGRDDIAGGHDDIPSGYRATISMRGRTRAGGYSKCMMGGKKHRRGKGEKNKGISAADVSMSQMLASAPMMMRASSRTRAGGKKMKRRGGRKTRKMKKQRKNKKYRSDITSTNLA